MIKNEFLELIKSCKIRDRLIKIKDMKYWDIYYFQYNLDFTIRCI